MRNNPNHGIAACCLLIIVAIGLSLAIAGNGLGQETKPASVLRSADLPASLSESLQVETENLSGLKTQLAQLNTSQQAIGTLLNAYKIQMSAHGQLLLLPGTEKKSLIAATNDNRAAVEDLEGHLKDLSKKIDNTKLLISQTEEQLLNSQSQLEELKKNKNIVAQQTTLIGRLQDLIELLNAKLQLLQTLQATNLKLNDQIQQAASLLIVLGARLDQQIEVKKKQVLFTRTASPLAVLGWLSIKSDVNSLFIRIKALTVVDTWRDELRIDWQSGRFALFTFIILYAIFQFFLIKLNRKCREYRQSESISKQPIRILFLKLLTKRIYLMGTVVLIYAFTVLSPLHTTFPFVRLLLWGLLIWLFTHWVTDFYEHLILSRRQNLESILASAKGIVTFIRYFALSYLFVDWLVGGNNTLLVLFRIVFDLTLIGWFYPWWRKFNAINEPPAAPWTPKQKLIIVSLQWLTYLIPTVGLVLELVGYGQLALYWFISWGLSLVVILWSSIVFLLLQEIRRHLKAPSSTGTEPATQPGHPIRWLILQVGWLVWTGATAALLMISWGGKQAVIVNFLTLLTTPITIGKISISVMSFVSAFLILVLTHTLVRLWRSFLKDKILADSGLEVGLQDSITMITVYSLWVFGILFSLHALGFGTTSMAVGFGALGIGLGFGLQNIFNNFISGIILLIERPIQVGDDVEVNGVWATVKKINVRATVVQTYDNASLIIPNSEFISQQVTNWSFKDKRLRRNIDVGVAYGSDIDLVRDTLLEIAKKSPLTLKQPKADVVFKDFADSALLFRLRVWTVVEKIFRTETDIRFEINRLFMEKGIVIAFPQSDVHLFVEKENKDWVPAEKLGEPMHPKDKLPFNENFKQEPE